MDEHPLNEIRSEGIIATLRSPSYEAAELAIEVLVAQRIRAIEITYTTPHAGALIAETVRRYGQDVLVGAGTLTSVEQVIEAAGAGATFFVSPGFDESVVAEIQRSGGTSIIGGFTATEVMNLNRRGVDAVKLFPSSAGGPSLLRALQAPFPDTAFIPTGGVTVANVGEWFAAGATALGVGGELIPTEALVTSDRDELTSRARAFRRAVDSSDR
jgi:2-dehydro-3-deoxyphosphogluconate aldolase/(4S)-4-hydroxy-2-oxoglutarate aldolase